MSVMLLEIFKFFKIEREQLIKLSLPNLFGLKDLTI